MTTYSAILTNAGEALYAAAQISGIPVLLNTFVIGDGGGSPVSSPDASRSTLVNQVYTGTINSITIDVTNPNLCWFEMDIPPSVGGFTVRETGLVTSGGALFAISNYPDTIKPIVAGGSAADLIINIGLVFSNTALVTLSIDPSVVGATRSWVEATITPAYLFPGGTKYQVWQKNSSTSGDGSWQDPSNPWEATIATTGGVANITALNAYNKLIKVTGTLTSPVTLTFPAAFGKWIVINATTGAFAVTAIVSGGAGVPILQGHAESVHSDGVNMFYSTASALNRSALDASEAIANTLYVDTAISAATPFRFVVPILSPYGTSPATNISVGDTPTSNFGKVTPQAIAFWMPVISTLNVANALKLRLYYTGDIGGGNYYLQLGYQVMANGSLSPASYTNTVEAVAAPATAGHGANYLTTVMIIPGSTLAVQDYVNFVLTRLSTNGSDTNAGNFQLVNITLEQ